LASLPQALKQKNKKSQQRLAFFGLFIGTINKFRELNQYPFGLAF